MSKPSRSLAAIASDSCCGGLVDRGLDLDEARLAGRAAGRHVGAEQVAVAGHRGQRGVAGEQRAGLRQVVDDGHPVEQPGERRADGVGAGDHVEGVRRASGSAGQPLTS